MKNLYKVCCSCREKKPATLEFFHKQKDHKYGVRSMCKKCLNSKNRDNYEKISGKKKMLKYKFGITLDGYNILHELQDGKCALCDRDRKDFNKDFAVDHDHNTGKVRGLLCMNCNMDLGIIENYKQNPERWDKYLKGGLI